MSLAELNKGENTELTEQETSLIQCSLISSLGEARTGLYSPINYIIEDGIKSCSWYRGHFIAHGLQLTDLVIKTSTCQSDIDFVKRQRVKLKRLERKLRKSQTRTN